MNWIGGFLRFSIVIAGVVDLISIIFAIVAASEGQEINISIFFEFVFFILSINCVIIAFFSGIGWAISGFKKD